jgi:SAM-dependent methyltransferase
MVPTYGPGDPYTTQALKHLRPKGDWLILAAGNGRYLALLAKTARTVLATDIDETALAELKKTHLGRRICTRRLDFTKRFPFNDNHFDGVLCTGALHLFKPRQVRRAIKETKRALKPDGALLFDFAFNVKRRQGKTRIAYRKGEAHYTKKTAKTLLKKCLGGFVHEMTESSVEPQLVFDGKKLYRFSCGFFLVNAKKQGPFGLPQTRQEKKRKNTKKRIRAL